MKKQETAFEAFFIFFSLGAPDEKAENYNLSLYYVISRWVPLFRLFTTASYKSEVLRAKENSTEFPQTDG